MTAMNVSDAVQSQALLENERRANQVNLSHGVVASSGRSNLCGLADPGVGRREPDTAQREFLYQSVQLRNSIAE